ncbi:MAG TPA: uracil-DNA glycosylase family protein, partial [Patescibacteria group bacterium]|nr:uracil-DNA glycosylase family protein [Patescibacteria group bacterium]
MNLKPLWAKTYVGPAGSRHPKIAIVGEQPGRSEIFHRPLPTPFVGPAGHELDKCLESAGLQRPALYLTNVIKDLDAPLASYIKLPPRGNPVVSEKGQEYINI